MAGPRNFQDAVDAAAYRLMGATQAEAAEAVGVSTRTVQRWEDSEWWPEAEKQGHALYVDTVARFARRTVLNSIKDGDAKTALTILERLDEKFAPNAVKVEQRVYRVGFPELDDEDDQADE